MRREGCSARDVRRDPSPFRVSRKSACGVGARRTRDKNPGSATRRRRVFVCFDARSDRPTAAHPHDARVSAFRRTNASFVNQARRVALRGAKTARAEDQIRHLMFSVVTPDRHSCIESSRAQNGNGRSKPNGFAHRKTRGSRSVYFQSNVTDAFRRSEAELACSEFSIVTTRTSVFLERRAPTDRDGRGAGFGGLGVRWSQKRALPYVTTCIRCAIGIARLFGAPTLARPRGGAPKVNFRRRRKARRFSRKRKTSNVENSRTASLTIA